MLWITAPRLVAGYCWDWNSKNARPWTSSWKSTTTSAGTCLLMGHSGSWRRIPSTRSAASIPVSLGSTMWGDHRDDLIVRDGKCWWIRPKRSRIRSIKGYKKLLNEDPESAWLRIKALIKNTYRTSDDSGHEGLCVLYGSGDEGAFE